MERMTFQELIRKASSMSPVSDEEFEKALNQRPRVEPREGVECETCGNHEYTWVVRDGEKFYKTCECKAMRDNARRLRVSGLSDQVKRCTFKSFETPHEWQREAKETVVRFVRDKERRWLLLSGQPGCGKTHLCTAAAGRFIVAGAETRYMCWVDESTALKACVTDDAEYSRKAKPLKECKVLYIDDFWKTQKGQNPTPADVKLAFDILNYRYCNRGLITIISTERTVDEMLEIDQGVGSRIYEMTKGYRLEFEGTEKNWRIANG